MSGTDAELPDGEEYVTNDRSSIKWGELGRWLGRGTLYATFLAYLTAVGKVQSWVVGSLQRIAEIPGKIFTAGPVGVAFETASSSAPDGVFGFVASLAIVLATMFAISRAIKLTGIRP